MCKYGTIKTAKTFNLLLRDNFTCQICGSSWRNGDNVKLEIDHKYPRSKGGVNSENNLQVLCFSCNRQKRDKVIYANSD